MADDVDNVIPLKRRSPGMAWMGELTRGDKGVHSTVSNTILIMGNDDKLFGTLAYDEFAHVMVATRSPPPPFADAPMSPGPYPRPVSDSDITLIQGHIQRLYDMRISQQIAQQAAVAASEINRVHPVRHWLNSLRWDGKPRIDSWLHDAFGVPRDAYHDAVAVKMLCAAIRRIRKPGCKFDHVPVLEGYQGAGKSRGCRALFGPDWFKDDLSHDLSDKDAQQGMAGRWGVELAELQVLVRSSSQAAKAFFSRQVDHFRPSYGRTFVERPRQCIFIGTTNETDYLSDPSGNRRYWPIACIKVEVAWIEENREQLWAEAAEIEAMGESLWLDLDNVRKDAEHRQSSRMAEDVWRQPVIDYVQTLPEVTVSDVLHKGLGLPRDRQNRGSEMRVTAILKGLGWMLHRYQSNGHRVSAWFAPGQELPGMGLRVPDLEEGD